MATSLCSASPRGFARNVQDREVRGRGCVVAVAASDGDEEFDGDAETKPVCSSACSAWW
jgi:hypothetical protein